MTIGNPSSGNRVQINGNGVTSSAPIDWSFWDQTDLKVIHTDADGTDTVWSYGISPGSWAFTGGDGSTGTVTFTAADLATGERLTVIPAEKLDQPVDLNSGNISQSAMEEAVDKLAARVQREAERVDRAVKLKESTTNTGGVVIDYPSEGKLLIGGAGGSVENGPTADEIANAQGYAEAAADAQTMAEAARDEAEGSATAAVSAATTLARAEFIVSDINASIVATGYLAADGKTYCRVREDSTATQPCATTNGGTRKWVPDGDITPLHFGAAGDGETDDAVALQAAADGFKERCAQYASNAATTAVFSGLGRTYKTTESLNFTKIPGIGYSLRDAVIEGHCTDRIVCDFTGSRHGHMSNFFASGDKVNMPSCGLYAARANAGIEGAAYFYCDCWTFEHSGAVGYFKLFAGFHFGQESTHYNHLIYRNRYRDGGVAYHGGIDQIPDGSGGFREIPTSEFVTALTGHVSNIENVFIDCEYRHEPIGYVAPVTAVTQGVSTTFTVSNVGDFIVGDAVVIETLDWESEKSGEVGLITNIVGNDITVNLNTSAWDVWVDETVTLYPFQEKPALILGRMRDQTFIGCYAVTYGGPSCVDIFNAGVQQSLTNLELGIHFEGSGTLNEIRLITDKAAQGRFDLSGGSITAYQVRGRSYGAVIGCSDPSADAVIFNDYRIKVATATFTFPSLFDDEAKYSLNGINLLVHNRAMVTPADFASLSGRVVYREEAETEVYLDQQVGDVSKSPKVGDKIWNRFYDASGALKLATYADVNSRVFGMSFDGVTADVYFKDNAIYPAPDGTSRSLGALTAPWENIQARNYYVSVGGVQTIGASGSFTTTDGKTVNVTKGLITSIV